MACSGCGCSGCASSGCLGFIGKQKEAFQGIPFDSQTYYAGGLGNEVSSVKSRFQQHLLSGGIEGVKSEPWQIRMKQLFSETRDYLEVKYAGVTAYVLVTPFGRDLYISWISFFHLGCLERLRRFGSAMPTHFDVDDLHLLGQDIDLCLKASLDEALRGVGIKESQVQKVFEQGKRKSFVKA